MTGLRTTVSCFDRIFEKASSEKYNLSIRLQPDGLLFSVHDPINQKYIGFESVILAGAPEIYEFIGKSELLTRGFRKTVCITPASKYTIVPGALFVADKSSEYFSFVYPLENGEELNSTKLFFDEAELIYATDMAYLQIIRDYFPHSIALPGVASFVNYILPRYRNTRSSAIFLNLYSDNFDLLLLNDGRMLFCNNFKFKTAEDLVYYTIFVIDQLKVNPEKVELKLSGNIPSQSELLKLLRKYIKTVDLLNDESDVQLSYALNELDRYRFIDLLNPRLCEL